MHESRDLSGWASAPGPSWPATGRARCCVPVGSLEQHGPHLPLDTDTRIAAAVARRAAAGDPALLLAPPLAYGASGEHEGFPGTLSIGHDALRAVLVELGRSAARWANRLVFVNGHGGNLPTVPGGGDPAARPRAARSPGSAARCPAATRTPGAPRRRSCSPWTRPWFVSTGWPAATPAPLAELLPTLVRGGVAAASPSGVLGDPRGATAAEGERLLAALVDRLRAALSAWAPDQRGRLG